MNSSIGFIAPRVRGMSKSVALAVLTAAALCVSAGTQAAPTSAAMKVSFSDLDLTKPAHAERLYARISKAAEQVCSTAPKRGSVLSKSAREHCVRDAIESAVQSISHPNLVNLYAAKTNNTKLAARITRSANS